MKEFQMPEKFIGLLRL